MIHKSEREALQKAIEAFDDAYINIVQATQRLLRILEQEDNEVIKLKKNKPEMTGNSCRQCGHFQVVRTGTCLTCQACGYNEGCG